MKDVARKGAKHGLAGGERGLIAATEDEQLARHRRRLAARERRIEHHDAALGRALGKALGVAGRDRRADGDDEARPRRLHDAAGAEHDRLDFVVEADDDDDELGRLCDVAGRATERHAERGSVSPRAVHRIAAGDVVSLGDKMPRHRRAHLAEAEHSDFPYCSHAALSASIAIGGYVH